MSSAAVVIGTLRVKNTYDKELLYPNIRVTPYLMLSMQGKNFRGNIFK